MKVLFVVDGLEGAHLAEPALWLADLASRLAGRGHRVDVVCRQPLEPWQEPEDPPGVTVWRTGGEHFETALGDALANEPEVVHVASRGPFGPRIVEALHELPVLLDVHDYWPICPNDDLLRRPRLHPCGEHFPHQGCGACAGLSRLRAMDERGDVTRAARIVMAHSAFARARLDAGLGRPVEVVEYGVDVRRFRPDPDPPLAPEVAELFADRGRPRVLFLGAPSHARGAGMIVDLVVALQSRIDDLEFVVAGRDPLDPDGLGVLAAEAKELGVARHLRLLPRVPPHDLPALLASCRAGVAPSVGHEPGGLAVLQALACGLPLVVAPGGVLPDLVRHGEEGLVQPVQDLSSFAAAVISFLVDPIAHAVFSDAARTRALERHDVERSLWAVEELYDRLRSGERHRAAA